MDKVRTFWNQLGTFRRVLAVTVPILVLILIVAIVVNLSGHSESWQYGYRHAGDATNFHSQGWSWELSCRSVGKMGNFADSSIDIAEAYDGCMAALAGEG